MKLPQIDRSSLRRKPHGFTLVEVMVSLAILGILASLAAPSFSDAIKRYRVKAIKDDLIASMQMARTEAIRRGKPVVLIRNRVSDLPECTAQLIDSDTWSCGWRIVEDTNSNGALTNTERANPIQVTTIPAGYDLMHPGKGLQMIFGVWGQAVGVGQRFVITNSKDGIGGAATITVCIKAGGRIRSLAGEATCD